MPILTNKEKNEALEAFSNLIEQEADFLLKENQQDLTAQEHKIAPTLYQRLKLDRGKIQQLVQGIQGMTQLPDPVGQVQLRTLLDEDLVLERRSVPIGVIAVVFESRPDVIPQILSLILKSGNAVVLKGGKEALQSNQAFMQLVTQLNNQCSFLPAGWATLFDTREAVQEMLAYHQYVDLVIPRGSNEFVQQVIASTKIPVLGHADGICHAYVHPSADIEQAVNVTVDSKTQYPAACNALETLLVDTMIANEFLKTLEPVANQVGIQLRGCPQSQAILPGIDAATESDWQTEYGDLTLAVRVVDDMAQAIQHINTYGSHHTDCILAADEAAQGTFLNQVDSASVFANASTRFADGFRYGFGAEVGISTAKTHARGPVGLEGLVIYKYVIKGNGHIAADYVGEQARPFLHKSLEV